MPSEPGELRADTVSYAYGEHDVLRNVSLSLQRGEAVALAGPNGSGKTTLLKLLGGDLASRQGEVTCDGEDIHKMRSRARARRIAMIPQQVDPNLTFPVRALVSMGRSPYVGIFGSLADSDREAVQRALFLTDTECLSNRPFRQLSGGEQQRVAVAMALAQETEYLLLDEPTVHLDLHHQHAVLELLSRLRSERDIGVLAVMHDLNLSALYFDRITVLSEGEVAVEGPVEDVLGSDTLLRVFRAPFTVVRHPREGVPQILLSRKS